MNKLKVSLLLLAIFVSTVTLAFYYENSYRIVVRFFFNFFQGAKIKFVGKNFHLFASPYFILAFGLFSILLTMLLFRRSKKGRFVYLGLTVVFFFITTMVTTYIDSTSKIIECTACRDGVINLHYNAVNYDFHFITSLVVGLLPLLLTFLKNKFQKGNSEGVPTTRK